MRTQAENLSPEEVSRLVVSFLRTRGKRGASDDEVNRFISKVEQIVSRASLLQAARAGHCVLGMESGRLVSWEPEDIRHSTCSVPGCDKPATHLVVLYDEYPYGAIFEEQDYTCPFICDEHKAINEMRACGVRRPRGFVRYPFTNQHWAQGWTKYVPIHSTKATAILNDKAARESEAA